MKKVLFLLFMLPLFTKAQVCSDEDTVRSVASSLITFNSARINGTTSHFSGAVTGLQLRYVRVGQTDTATASGSYSSALRNLTGLQANTQYLYYYKTICGSGTNRGSNYYFTTLTNSVTYTPMDAKGYQFKYFKADSGLIVPRGDTSIVSAPNIGGQIKFRSADSLFYGYNGAVWKPLAIDSFGIITLLNRKVDSVTVSGDSLFYWVNGTSYGYVFPNAATRWSLTGNSGTTAGTNFLGNTDNVGLMFKVNNLQSGYIDIIKSSTSLGYGSLYSNTTGYNNTAFGVLTLGSNTTGIENTAVGHTALQANTTGSGNTSVGLSTLAFNTTGNNNTAIGYGAQNVTTGSNNTAIGYSALPASTGNRNIAIGAYAGNNSDDSDRVYINSIDRVNRAGDSTKSIIYGVQNTTVANQRLDLNATVNISVVLKLASIAYAGLPSSPAAGTLAHISDSNTNTWGATIAGGGANVVIGFYNGANWTVMGK